MTEKTIDYEGTTYIQGQPFQHKPEMGNFQCHLSDVIYKVKRRIEYISTRELEKLKSCKNLEEVKAQIQAETDLLKQIFDSHPELIDQKKVEFDIPFDMEHKNLLELVEKLASYHFIVTHTSEKSEQSIASIRLLISRETRASDSYFIDDVQIIQKSSK